MIHVYAGDNITTACMLISYDQDKGWHTYCYRDKSEKERSVIEHDVANGYIR